MIRLSFLALAAAAGLAQAQLLPFTETETRAILQHGPWPMPWTPDPSNRVSGNAQAVALGASLFFDPRLSRDSRVACTGCHLPGRLWQDGLPRARGFDTVERNTPTLLDVRHHRWFGWDGAGDTLWAQSIRPLLDPREMDFSAAGVARLLREDADYACAYGRAFGAPPPRDDEAALVGAAKALAAFQETLVGGRTPFDDFRDALARGDRDAAARYPLAAQRGLRLFVGRGNCSVCHFGPAFTNGEFHDVGIPFFVAPGKVDPGRHAGIRALRASRWNLLGKYNDDAGGAVATRTRHVTLEHRNFGEFKVPGLRNVARTAPYMHNGSLATLADVVRHYSEVSPDRLHSDGEALVRALRLTPGESADLVAFLESLSEREPASPPQPSASACRP